MRENKIAAYLGFALRARKVVLGVGAAQTAHGICLLVVDRTASENSRKEIEKIRKRENCPLVEVDDLEGMTGKAYCKLAAVREENLARAILRETEISETEGQK